MCWTDQVGRRQAQRRAPTVFGCKPGQATFWISSETYTSGRTQEDDAVVFCQPSYSSRSHLLAHVIFLLIRNFPRPSWSHKSTSTNNRTRIRGYGPSYARLAYIMDRGSKFERTDQCTRCFPFLTSTITGAKILKHKEFESALYGLRLANSMTF